MPAGGGLLPSWAQAALADPFRSVSQAVASAHQKPAAPGAAAASPPAPPRPLAVNVTEDPVVAQSGPPSAAQQSPLMGLLGGLAGAGAAGFFADPFNRSAGPSGADSDAASAPLRGGREALSASVNESAEARRQGVQKDLSSPSPRRPSSVSPDVEPWRPGGGKAPRAVAGDAGGGRGDAGPRSPTIRSAAGLNGGGRPMRRAATLGASFTSTRLERKDEA